MDCRDGVYTRFLAVEDVATILAVQQRENVEFRIVFDSDDSVHGVRR